ncbi:type I restriction-modification system DNA methylase subunit [Catenulispora sp. GP43]|uniref:N-6 DNA methylase n=1 Tax=Catenulispora sp. GP43 TaxID=3156263 RepID=UPI003512EB64
MTEQTEVTAAQIARLAGVGRAAVSNWRRRHSGFPAPVGGSDTSPTFSLAEVERWLRAEGKLAEIPAGEQLWRAVDGAGSAGGGEAATAAALAALGTALASGGEASGGSDLLDQALAIAGDTGRGEVFEELLGRYLDVYARDRDTGSATPALAALMAAIAMPRERADKAVVHDPSCGAGTLLLAAAAAGAGSLVGQTADDVLAPLAQARLAVAVAGSGRTADARTHDARTLDARTLDVRTVDARTLDVRAGDALLAEAHPALEADTVLCQPPSAQRDWGYDELAYDPRWEYGMPPRAEAELAWVQHAAARLRAGGTAAILLPPAVAARRPGRRVRAELLRRGALRAVVGLPAGSAAPYGLSLHLWVLRRPGLADPAPSRVLFIDQSDADRSGRADRVPSESAAERILAAWRAFDRDPEAFQGESGLSVALPIIDLLDDAVDLSPGRHVPRPDTGLGYGRLLEYRTTTQEILARLADVLPPLGTEAEPATVWPSTTLGDLARAGALSIAGDVEVAAGDILVPVLGGALGQARVVAEGDPAIGTLPGRGASVVRTDPARLDPWFVAGYLRSDTVARQAVSHASTSSRMDLRKAPLPRLPLERQRGYAEAFRRIAEFGDVLRQAADAGERLVQGITDALAEGTVTPSGGEGKS